MSGKRKPNFTNAEDMIRHHKQDSQWPTNREKYTKPKQSQGNAN